MGKADTGSATRNNRSICVPISQEVYSATVAEAGNPLCQDSCHLRSSQRLLFVDDLGQEVRTACLCPDGFGNYFS